MSCRRASIRVPVCVWETMMDYSDFGDAYELLLEQLTGAKRNRMRRVAICHVQVERAVDEGMRFGAAKALAPLDLGPRARMFVRAPHENPDFAHPPRYGDLHTLLCSGGPDAATKFMVRKTAQFEFVRRLFIYAHSGPFWVPETFATIRRAPSHRVIVVGTRYSAAAAMTHLRTYSFRAWQKGRVVILAADFNGIDPSVDLGGVPQWHTLKAADVRAFAVHNGRGDAR